MSDEEKKVVQEGRKATDDNEQKPQVPTDDHGTGSDPDGSEATGTGPSGGGDPGVPEH